MAALILGFALGVLATSTVAWISFRRAAEARRRDAPSAEVSGCLKAYAVMSVRTWDQSLGQVTANEHRARAVARQERARGRVGDRVELVEYRAWRKLEI